MMNNLKQVASSIKNGNNFLIFTHSNMDGDALGSSSALCLALRAAGKNAYVYIDEEISHYLSPFADEELLTRTNPFDSFIAIAVDCGEISRLDKRGEVYALASLRLCIDHHETNESLTFADFNFSDVGAAATGILVYKLLRYMNMPLNKKIAEFLYVAISSDTGGFRFHNANPESLIVASELYEYGIEHVDICNLLFSSIPFAQARVEARAIEKAELLYGGRAVITDITIKDLEELGADYPMAHSCIDRLRSIEGCEIICVLKELEPESFNVSFRSKKDIPVIDIAAAFGGGGHKMAAGCTVNAPLDKAKEMLIKEIKKELERYTGNK